MKTVSLLKSFLAILITSSFCLPGVSAPATPPLSSEKKAAIDRFLKQVSQPEARTYRQMIASLRPFVPGDFLDQMQKNLAPQMDIQFPKYQLIDQGESYALRLGSGSQKAELKILKNDPRIFAIFKGQAISHAEAQDPWKFMEKIKSIEEKGPTTKSSLIFSLALTSAHAFNWALFGGLSLLGLGIAMGLRSLSRSKITTEHQVDVNIPEKYDVDVDTSFSVPIIDKVIDGQK